MSLLLIQGADPNARDNWNYTPLHEAAIKGKIDVCIGERELNIQIKNFVGLEFISWTELLSKIEMYF